MPAVFVVNAVYRVITLCRLVKLVSVVDNAYLVWNSDVVAVKRIKILRLVFKFLRLYLQYLVLKFTSFQLKKPGVNRGRHSVFKRFSKYSVFS